METLTARMLTICLDYRIRMDRMYWRAYRRVYADHSPSAIPTLEISRVERERAERLYEYLVRRMERV